MTRDALQAIRDTVLGREPTPYNYRDNETWNATLQGLEPTCLLWRRFLDYDAARLAFETLDDTHRRWENELGTVNRRLRLADPDTTDTATFTADFARGNLITTALTEQRDVHTELRQRRDTAQENWQQLFGAYQTLLETTWRVKQEPRQMDTPGMASPRSDKLAELDAERRRFET